jgi:hypothetical protein
MPKLKQQKKRLKMHVEYLRGGNGKLRSAEEVEDEFQFALKLLIT